MRRRRPTLRGSVTQSSGSVRVRAAPRFGLVTRITIVAVTVVSLFLLGLWIWHSGWLHRQSVKIAEDGLRLTQKAHYAVSDIVVEGRQQTNKDQLYLALGVTAGSPMFAFDPKEAEARIAKLPWVDSVVVQRRLPDTLYVRLIERVPMARWQRDSKIAVIDTEGKILPDTNPEQFPQLPLVVGVGAADDASELLKTLQTFPAVNQKLMAAVRVGNRRWDLHLQPKIIARMPETDLSDALKRLSILISEQKILERDIIAIDLRIPDRLTIEEPPSAAPAQHNGDHP